MSPVLYLARESNSSKITTQGDDAFAFLKISLIAFSDSPTHLSLVSLSVQYVLLLSSRTTRDGASLF